MNDKTQKQKKTSIFNLIISILQNTWKKNTRMTNWIHHKKTQKESEDK